MTCMINTTEAGNVQKNEIVITRSDVVLRGMDGREFTIGKNHYDVVRKAITTSKQLLRSNKHKVIQIDLDSWNDHK